MSIADHAAVTLDALASEMSGELVRPEDEIFDEARSVWNGMIDLRPAGVARCTSTDDVRAAIAAARSPDFRSPCEEVGTTSPASARSTVGSSSTSRRCAGSASTPRLGAFASAAVRRSAISTGTQAHGLVVPSGVVSETGIAGLTLSGGLGWVRRKWGLSCDSLVGATS